MSPARRTLIPLAAMVAAAVVAPIAWLPAGPALAAPGQTGLPASALAPPGNPKVVVTFAWGGGLADQMPALQMFGKYGMHATYFVPTGLMCTLSQAQCRKSSPYLTIADVREIAADGNEIGGLSVTHQQLTTMPAAEAEREICDDRSNLFRLGFRATDFAYPFALVSPAVEALTRACGYNAGLGAGTLNGAGLCQRCAPAETIPPKDPYNVRTPVEVNSVNTRWTPGTFESTVTDAQQHGGGWIVFTIHDICTTNCNLGTTPAILGAVLAWLHGQRGRNVAVETMRQVIGGPVRPAVAGPAPPARPAGVANADLARASGGVPACFQLAAYGGSVASFSYRAGGGPRGSAAETVRVTSAGAGNAKLVQVMDLGLCAPPVSPGRAYTAGVWYESSRPAQLDVYRRTSLGGWSYWTTSPFFPASASWRQASWTTPAVPPDTTALSFGLTANGVGTVTTSDYSLKPAKSYKMVIILGVLLFAIVALSLIARGYYRYMKAEMAEAETEAALAKAEAAQAQAELAHARALPARAQAEPAPVQPPRALVEPARALVEPPRVEPARALADPDRAQALPDRVLAEQAEAHLTPVRVQPHLARRGGGLRRTGQAELTHPGLAATPLGRYRNPAGRARPAEGAPRLAHHGGAVLESVRGILIHLYEDEASLPVQGWLADTRRLLLVDDFRMVTQALASRLSAARGLWVAGCCTRDDPKLPEVVRWLRPDVIVIEVEPLGVLVGEVVQRLLAAWPAARVVVVSGNHDVSHAVDAARAGASAWLSKEGRAEGGRAGQEGADELEIVVGGVCQGDSWFPPEMLGSILRELRDDVRKAREDSDPLAVLSPGERDVLASMAEGKRASQIAEQLLISADTVRTHTRSIFTKLDVRSRPEAVRVARAAGLRPPEHPEINGNGRPAAVPIRPRARAGGGGRAASNGRQPPAT